MNKIILIDNRIAIRTAISTLMKNDGYEVVETTYIENVFDLNRITFKDRINLTGIIVATVLITDETKETIKRILSSKMYEDVPVYILSLDIQSTDTDDEAGYIKIATDLLDNKRFVYITKYKQKFEEES